MPTFNLSEHPHRRYNALTGEWILVSPHRGQRPWQGRVESVATEKLPRYDPACYLCPGNKRANGDQNPNYSSTFVFDNDFSSLQQETQRVEINTENLLRAKGEPGICRVVCFSPRHDLTLAEMDTPDIRKVIDVWTEEYVSLGKKPFINYVQIFENKGEAMGCSNPHPHGQIWAEETIPVEPTKEMENLKRHFQIHKRTLLEDYLSLELKTKERIVLENQDFVVLVPFWAVWPFETMIVSRRKVKSLADMSDKERDSFADAIKRITTRYDNVFSTSFPYTAGIHQAPTDEKEHGEWHLHMHFYPPLLRSATVKKFMVGYEMLANPQRDVTPELSAAKLRELGESR